MGLDSIVLVDGELHYIVGMTGIQTFLLDGTPILTNVLAVNKIETSTCAGIQRVTWLPEDLVTLLLSAMEYQYTEWYLGVINGNS